MEISFRSKQQNMDPKEETKKIKEYVGDLLTPQEVVVSEYKEAEEFLEEYLPSKEPTAEEYIAAYQKIEALRNSTHPHRQQEHADLAILIERGLPFSSKGFNLIAFQIYSEVMRGVPREESLVDGSVFIDFDQWLYGYPSFRLWRMVKQQNQSAQEREAVERMIWRLLTYSTELHAQLDEEYQEKKTVEKEIEEKKAKEKKPLNIVPKVISKNVKKVAEKISEGNPDAVEDLGNTVERFKRTKTYFETMIKIFRNPENLFVNFDQKIGFWMGEEGEIVLSHLITSNREDFRNIYYSILERITSEAELKRNSELRGRVGTRHALRLKRIDPFLKDFTDVEYWRGINLPSKKKEKAESEIVLPRKNDGDDRNGFQILGSLLRSNDIRDARIYKKTMLAFLEYLEKNKSEIADYEISKNFFKTQYAFDLIFNLPEEEKEIEEEDTSFNFVLRKYLWLKYGPEYIEENPSLFDIKLWKLQKNILLKGVKIFEDLFRAQDQLGQNGYEIHRDFYQEAKSDLEEQYTQSGWHLIMYTTRRFADVRDIFSKAFEKFRVNFSPQDEKLFYLAILLGTLDFALTMKHRENLKKVGASTLRHLHGTKLPTAFEEVSEKAEQELGIWRFKKDTKDPTNPRLQFDNNLINSLRNLSIMWGRGYGVTVFIEQAGIRVKNPLHTMGEEKEVKKGDQIIKERPNKGGRDEVLIPWEIILKATPQFDYISWTDSILRLVGKYRATMGRKDLDWISDLAAKGPAVIRFEAAGSERNYELPPLPKAREVAKILKEIAKQMVVLETPHPKEILKNIE